MTTNASPTRLPPGVVNAPVVVGRSWVKEPAGWDSRLCGAPEGSYRQTSFYAQYQGHWRRERALYLTAHIGDEPVGQMLALLGGLGAWGMARRPLSSLTLPLARRILPQMYWLEGPVLLAPSRRHEICSALLNALTEEARRCGCVNLEGVPSFYGAWSLTDREMYRKAIIDQGFQVETKRTLAVNLGIGLDGLWSNLRREARNKTRRAESDGIGVVRLDGSEDQLRGAHRIVRETAERNGLAPLCWEHFKYSFEYHQRCGLAEEFVSLYKGGPLSYQRVVYYNGVAVLGGISYSDYSRKFNLYGNDLMQWRMIQWAHRRGMRWLDYGGAEPDSTDPKMRSIYQFKAKWGGELIEYDRYRLRDGGSIRRRLFAAVMAAGRGRI